MEEGTHLTRTGSIVGSTGWLAPEQVTGDPVTFATDVHAWALCVLFAATGMLLAAVYAAPLSGVFLFAPLAAGEALLALIPAVALLAISLLVLPITPDVAWKPSGEENPSWRIPGLLTLTIGLPYFILSTTSPLLQSWFARSFHHAIPYRLFALSNLASLLALLAEYQEGDREARSLARKLVISAKDHAKWSNKPEKPEMILWMMTWLENPPLFPTWLALRKNVGRDPEDSSKEVFT